VVESPDLTIPLVVAAAAVIPTVVSAIDVPSVEVPPAVVEKKAAPLMPPPPIIEPVAAPIAAPIAAGGGFQWWWLLPLLLLPLFWWLFSKGCNEPKVAVVPPKVETVVTPPPAVDTLKRETAPKVAETKIGNIVLRSIFFDFDKSDLRPVSQSDLDNLVKVLQENPTYNAELKAFTDAKGSDAYNRALSMRRANNAKSYVVSKGIAKNRIKTSTFGESNPIAKNEVNGQDTEEGRQFNRRVEVAVFDSAGKQVGLVEQIAVPESLKK
jgi:outer membrane protein OmpA-like peptidoglycan-associated protein